MNRLWTQIEDDLVCRLRLVGLGPTAIAQCIQHLRPGVTASIIGSRLYKHGATPPSSTWVIEDTETYRRAARGEITDEEALQLTKQRYIRDCGEEGWCTWLSSKHHERLGKVRRLEPFRAEIPTDPKEIPAYCRKIINEATEALAAEYELSQLVVEPRACPLCGCVPPTPGHAQ